MRRGWIGSVTYRRVVDVVRRDPNHLERDTRHHRETTAPGQNSTEELSLRRFEDEKVPGSQ